MNKEKLYSYIDSGYIKECGESKQKLFYVSNDGKVFSMSKKTGKVLQNKLDHNGVGYKSVKIGGDKFYIHRLVACKFIDNPNNYNIVNHLDSNRENNNYSNLEWTTSKGNTNHAWENGKMEKIRESARKTCSSLGKRTGKINGKKNSLLTSTQIEEVMNSYKEGISQVSLSKMYGVSPQVINYIIKKRP